MKKLREQELEAELALEWHSLRELGLTDHYPEDEDTEEEYGDSSEIKSAAKLRSFSVRDAMRSMSVRCRRMNG